MERLINVYVKEEAVNRLSGAFKIILGKTKDYELCNKDVLRAAQIHVAG